MSVAPPWTPLPVPSSLLDLSRLERSFQQHGQALPVLRGIDLRIHAGEAIGIQGASGSGKSTLLSILGLIDLDYKGTYRLEGRDARTIPESERARIRLTKFGLAFQDLWLIPALTATENCLVPLHGIETPPADAQKRVQELFSRARLEHCANRRPGELSGGERRRVALARALVNRPPILILDEPTAELDEESAEASLDLIHDAHRAGATLIAASHDERLLATCTQRYRMRDGVLEPREATGVSPPSRAR